MCRVRKLAEAKGINKNKLSQKAQLTGRTISGVWNGISDGTKVSTLKKVAEVLDVPVWHLFDGAPPLPPDKT